MWQIMKNKVALVTGATSGIGRSTALMLAKQGIHVALAGRNKKRGEQIEQEIKASGKSACFIQTDVTQAESIRNCIDSTIQTFGAIHYAVNNAGIEGTLRPLVELEESHFTEVINSNLKSVWLCLKYQLPVMDTHVGAIVNISTTLAQMGLAGTSLYAASKAGVESLTRVAAIENGKKGLRVNAVSPGSVDTPLIRRIYPKPEQRNQLASSHPSGRIATAEDIAHTIFWLLSPFATHVNGEIVVVDGGHSVAC